MRRMYDIIKYRTFTCEKEKNKMEQVDYINYDRVDEKTRASMDRLFAASKKSFWIRKRFFDVVVSFLAFIVLLPFFIIMSLIIFIDDPHAAPIFA